jgi:hypothetical protein
MQLENLFIIKLEKNWFCGTLMRDRELAQKGAQVVANAYDDNTIIYQLVSDPRAGKAKVESMLSNETLCKVGGRLFVKTDITASPKVKKEAVEC